MSGKGRGTRSRGRSLTALVLGAVVASVLAAVPALAEQAPVVTVDATADLVAAAAGGAGTILLEPGTYVLDEPLVLADVDLVGTGPGVVLRVADPGLARVLQRPAVFVSGMVEVRDVGFEGGGFAYIASAFAADAAERNRIAIRDCRFTTELPSFDPDVPFDESLVVIGALIGDLFAERGSAARWDVEFSGNRVSGGFAGLVVGSFYSDSRGGRVHAVVEGNVFSDTLDPGVVVIGSFSGINGTVRGVSRDNTYTRSDLSVGGGVGDFFFGIANPGVPGPGGSFGRVDWTSRDERFLGAYGGITGYGGRRYRAIDAPSEGNVVRLKVLSPTFDGNLFGDVEILGSSINDPDPILGDFSANGDGAGNTITVTMIGADFSGAPGRVRIRDHGGTFRTELGDASAEPEYGNEARFTGSPRAFERANPGVNEIARSYFTGGGPAR